MEIHKKIILCTGAPGHGREELLLSIINNEMIKIYDLFNYMFKEAELNNVKLSKVNILDYFDTKPDKIYFYLEKAINKIILEINNNDLINIISMPHFFEWRGNKFYLLKEEYLKLLNPDYIMIVIDDIVRVHNRLEKDIQWNYQVYSLDEIARWRREEILGLYEISERVFPNMKIYLMPFENGPNFFLDMLMNSNKKKIYLSHPITGEGLDFYKKIRNFANLLSPYYIVFDPYMIQDWNIVEQWNQALKENNKKPQHIEVVLNYSNGSSSKKIYNAYEMDASIKNLRHGIIDIDYKMIQSCDLTVVYHPRKEISAGVIAEMIESFNQGKIVYLYYPYYPTPYLERYSTHFFYDENEFFNFLVKESMK